jgi:hypothetical protein
MGMFSETAIVYYRLSFTDLGKQTSVFLFCFQFVYIFVYKYIYIYIYIHLHTCILLLHICIYRYIYIYIFIYIYSCRFKRKMGPWPFSLICLPITHHANGSLSFVSLLTKKETRVIRLQMD